MSLQFSSLRFPPAAAFDAFGLSSPVSGVALVGDLSFATQTWFGSRAGDTPGSGGIGERGVSCGLAVLGVVSENGAPGR